jgi:hypothetical protein
MKFTTYEEVLKDSVAVDIQARFADEIHKMAAIGFNEEFYLREMSFPFSALLFFPVLIHMHYKGERIQVGGLLQAITFNPYFIHEDSYAYGLVTKLGVLYGSMFDDGTLLTTTSYDIGVNNDPDYRFIRQFSSQGGYEGAWKQHAKTVKELTTRDRNVITPIGMKDVTRMAQRYDQIAMYITPEDLKEKRKNNG